jgi:serine/threonine protein kinase
MDGSGEIIRAIAASHLSFKYEELRRATDEFNQINKLGQGGYGTVYKVLHFSLHHRHLSENVQIPALSQDTYHHKMAMEVLYDCLRLQWL